MEKEIRVINANLSIEKRNDKEDDNHIVGYAAMFNKDSEDMGFIERIAPGAFKNAIKRSDVRVLFNHDPNIIIGRSGINLNLSEDSKGLLMEVSPIDDDDYRMVSNKISNGLITQQSFGFTVEEDKWEDLDKDTPKRTITKIRDLFDVSPVTFPAYPDTEVGIRSRDEARFAANGDKNKTEAILRTRAMDILIKRAKLFTL